MKNVSILDCTLRDGGRLFNCAFDDNEIKDVAKRLAISKIDIIEVGFIRNPNNVTYKGNSTFFTSVSQIRPFIDKKVSKALYTAFIDFGMADINNLEPYDGSSVDGIRLGFTKKNYDEEKSEVIRWANIIKERGYKLFIQGVNSLNYTDKELLEIIDMVNEIHPYSFGIVDTYGAMYIDDVDRLYRLVDDNMLKDICINFHSHNNYQLSFAFAQEVIKLSENSERHIIIDGTLSGMGKVAGNLCTELIINYLTRKKHYDYDLDEIFDIIDDYIHKYREKYSWGYSVESMMAGIYKSHPNNVIYLTEKFRLRSKDIGKILSMIDAGTRQRYDYDNIQKLYTEYVADGIDDKDTVTELRKVFEGKNVLIMCPGSSLNIYKEKVDKYIEDKKPLIVSVNFVSDKEDAYVFFGNQKRYSAFKNERAGHKVIVPSNIETDSDKDIRVNYHSLINRDYTYFENSTMMLLNLLKKLNPESVAFAGFDGFDTKVQTNYYDNSYQNDRHKTEFESLNKEIKEMLTNEVKTMSPTTRFSFVTPSLYEECVK